MDRGAASPSPASPTSPFRAGSQPGSRSPICEDPSGPISSRGPRCQEHLPQNRAIDRTLDTDADIAQLDLNHAGLVHHRRRRRVAGHHHRYECRAASHIALGIFRAFRRLPPPKQQKTGADVMTPGHLRHAAAWLKALSHEAALRLRIPPPTTASPRDHLDAAQRVAATVMDRHMPTFIVILTTIRCHPSLAQNDLAKPSSGISRKNSRWCHHDAHFSFAWSAGPRPQHGGRLASTPAGSPRVWLAIPAAEVFYFIRAPGPPSSA